MPSTSLPSCSERRPGRRPTLCRRRSLPFTLIEVLAATALVVVVALLASKFFANMQNVWQHSAGRTSTHEDARLALGLIAADLQALVARLGDLPGQDIRLHQPAASGLWFVTDAEADTTVPCSLIEVGYRLQGDCLQRAFVDQSSAAWNLYGDRDDADDQSGYQTVIDGVLDLRFICYDGHYAVITPAQTSDPPALIGIRLSVLDPRDRQRWLALPPANRPAFAAQAARTFWKTVRPR